MVKNSNYGERMVRIETDINYIKKTAQDTNTKMDNFITAADKKYATKEELNDIKSSVKTNDSRIWIISKEVAKGAGIAIAVVALLKFFGI